MRQAALPTPGTDEQLEEFVARIQQRPLDRSHPLWEVYLVEGLEHDRFAVVTKTHHALVDGAVALDIAQLVVRDRPGFDEDVVDTWRPRHEPSDLQLVAGAVTDAVFMPGQVIDSVRDNVDEAREIAGRVVQGLGSLVSTVVRGAARAGAHLPAQRGDRRGPPVRHGRHRPRRLPQGPLAAWPAAPTPTTSPSTTSSSRRSPGPSGRGC